MLAKPIHVTYWNPLDFCFLALFVGSAYMELISIVHSALRCPQVDARRHPVFKGRCISDSLWRCLLHMGCNKPRELPSELLGAAGRHRASHSGQCQ